MPPRLNKRQQRELEDLQVLGSGTQMESSEPEEESTSPPRKTASSVFSAVIKLLCATFCDAENAILMMV
jgi:hypothetical protein